MNRVFTLLILCCMVTSAFARTPIIFWHSMSGSARNAVIQIARGFNQSQSAYELIPIYKGNYSETLTNTVAAFRVGEQPDLVQILEVGSATMMYPPGATIPIHQILAKAGITLAADTFIPSIGHYYSDSKNRLVAVPFNASIALLYFNKSAFLKAGLDPNHPPTTWPELETIALQLQKHGMQCGFTTTWPSWIQIESLSVWHNAPVVEQTDSANDLSTRLHFSDNPVLIHHLDHLAEWEKTRLFQYGGAGDDAQALFTSGHCAMILQSSGALEGIKQIVPFQLGVTTMPTWPQYFHGQHHALIGGGALWAMSGKSDKTYRGIAQFFKYLLRSDVQVAWQNQTGYLPVTKSAYYYAERKGYYAKKPESRIAVEALLLSDATNRTAVLRMGNYTRIREINMEALESIWSGQMSTKSALQWAQSNGNHVLTHFQKAVS